MKAVLVLLALLQSSYSIIIHCPDQSESCQCPENADECEFTFNVQQRFSFASYPFNPVYADKGYLYFLNSTGYHPTSQERTSECFLENAVNDEDFTNNNCSIPMTLDGVNYRPLLLINNRIPGPTLVVYENQILIIHVLNNLEDIGITIHWHGMYQLHSPWMDGVGYITQAPIDAGSSFDYIFRAQPSGTHWYHSHIGSQKSDGLFGALVILERRSLGDILGNSMYNAVVNNPGQHTLTLIDWQRKVEAIAQALSDIDFYPQLPIGELPSNQDMPSSARRSEDGASLGLFPFWSGLINGRGRKESSTATPLSIFDVSEGNTYHFRLVGSISIFALRVSVDGHKLKAIASDGEYFEPVEVDYIIIHTGETYDFLLEANQSRGSYWIRAETLEVLPPGEEHSARAILTYGNRGDLDWRTAYHNVPELVRDCSTPCKVLNCPFKDYFSPNLSCVPLTSLVGLTGTPESEVPRYPPNEDCFDCSHFLNFAFQGESLDSSVNSRSFKLPSVAYSSNCFRAEEEGSDKTSNSCNNCEVNPMNTETGGCLCIDVVPISTGVPYDLSRESRSVAMVLSSISAHFAHPIHLHGHSFHVIYIGYSEYNRTTGKVIGFTDDIVCNGDNRLCVNPRWARGEPPQAVLSRTSGGRVVNSAIRKDTVIIPAGGYVVIAFQADNPGFWFMHCHIEEHLLDGMAIVVQEYPHDQQWAPPPGINLHGSFKWTVDEYRKVLASRRMCSSELFAPTLIPAPNVNPPITEDVSDCPISEAGFVVSMNVIALLATSLVILIVVFIILMWRYKKTTVYKRKAPS